MNSLGPILIAGILSFSAFAGTASVLSPTQTTLGQCGETVRVSRYIQMNYPAIVEFLKISQCLPVGNGNRRGLNKWLQLIGIDQYSNGEEIANTLPGIKGYLAPRLKNDFVLNQQLYELALLITQKQSQIPSIGEVVVLNEEAGKGRFSDLKPGWLWQQLLIITQGNAQQAITMLGIVFADPTYEHRFEPLHLDFTYNFYRPLFQIPKAIAPELDIPSDLKRSIHETYILDAHLQKPNEEMPREALAAKVYHTDIAAFMSCEMIEAGMSPAFATKVQKLTAWGYRTAHLQGLLQAIHDKMRRGDQLNEDESTNTDAAFLMKRYFIGGRKLFGLDIPQTDVSLKGLLHLNPKIQQPLNWTDARFQKSQARLKSWLIDWKWTVAQHELGSRFAAKFCTSSGRPNLIQFAQRRSQN